jgi:hypothetical protein
VTIFREDCGYGPLPPERAAEFGVAPEDAGLWHIETDYGMGPLMPGGPLPEGGVERLIPNTLARLAGGHGIAIGALEKPRHVRESVFMSGTDFAGRWRRTWRKGKRDRFDVQVFGARWWRVPRFIGARLYPGKLS